MGSFLDRCALSWGLNNMVEVWVQQLILGLARSRELDGFLNQLLLVRRLRFRVLHVRIPLLRCRAFLLLIAGFALQHCGWGNLYSSDARSWLSDFRERHFFEVLGWDLGQRNVVPQRWVRPSRAPMFWLLLETRQVERVLFLWKWGRGKFLDTDGDRFLLLGRFVHRNRKGGVGVLSDFWDDCDVKTHFVFVCFVQLFPFCFVLFVVTSANTAQFFPFGELLLFFCLFLFENFFFSSLDALNRCVFDLVISLKHLVIKSGFVLN